MTAGRSSYSSEIELQKIQSPFDHWKLQIVATSWACFFWCPRVWLFFLSRFHDTQLIYFVIFTQIVQRWCFQLLSIEPSRILGQNTACRHPNVSSHEWDIHDNNKFILEHLISLSFCYTPETCFIRCDKPSQYSGQKRTCMSNGCSSAFLTSGLQYRSWWAAQRDDSCADIGKGKLRLKIQQGLFRYWIHSTKQETQARTKCRHCNAGPLTHWCIYQISLYCDGSNLASLVLPAITMYLMGHNLKLWMQDSQ